MRVGDIRALTGPNVYSHRPVLSMRLYLDDLTGKESREFPGFNELLLEMLPGLAKHHCCMEREGGFAERLREGTYFGHIIEHIAEEGTKHLLRMAVEITESLTLQAKGGEAFQLEERLRDVRKLIACR